MCQEICQTKILPQSGQLNRLIEDLTITQKHSDFFVVQNSRRFFI